MKAVHLVCLWNHKITFVWWIEQFEIPVLFSLFVLFFTQICQKLSEDIIIWTIHMPLLISSIKQSLYAEHVLMMFFLCTMLMFVSIFRTSLLDQYRPKLLKGELWLYRQSVCFVFVSMEKNKMVLSCWLKQWCWSCLSHCCSLTALMSLLRSPSLYLLLPWAHISEWSHTGSASSMGPVVSTLTMQTLSETLLTGHTVSMTIAALPQYTCGVFPDYSVLLA